MEMKIVCKADTFTCRDVQSDKRKIEKTCLDFCTEGNLENSPIEITISPVVNINKQNGIRECIEIKVFVYEDSERIFLYEELAERLKKILGDDNVVLSGWPWNDEIKTYHG